MNLSEIDKELITDIVEQKLRHYKLINEPNYLAHQKEVDKELSQPKQEESTKWDVIVEQFEHNKKDHKIVIAYTDHHILSYKLAQSAATKIRELLLGL